MENLVKEKFENAEYSNADMFENYEQFMQFAVWLNKYRKTEEFETEKSQYKYFTQFIRLFAIPKFLNSLNS